MAALMAAPFPARLLWDSGGVWALMTLEACDQAGLAIAPISAAQVIAGELEQAGLLVVPGGWSARKKRALGPDGASAIHEFILNGGRYLGFCGGAGLALDVPDGLGLISLGRAQGAQRLPGLSGPVSVSRPDSAADHVFWEQAPDPAGLHIWWPGQFDEPADPDIQVIARYRAPLPGLHISDTPIEQVLDQEVESPDYAQDPASLWGQPAALEARLGRGGLLLCYPHLDTPGCEQGRAILQGLWRHWLGSQGIGSLAAPQPESSPRAQQMARQARDLWNLGQDLGLWQPRHMAMPLWRRGARGLEFWELKRLTEAMAGMAAQDGPHRAMLDDLERAMEPVFRDGPAVLAAQAALLAEEKPQPRGTEIDALWFPRPRRTGGDMDRALASLEKAVFLLASKGRPD